MKVTPSTRRQFIKTAAAAVTAFNILPRHVLGRPRLVPPREKEKAVDAILCATPDHLHAYVSTFAMRAGKHAYCEKPLTHNLWEAREVARVARETGLATQMGNQGHSTVGIRETVEHLRAGTIGKVRDIHAWVPAKRWNPTLVTKPTDTPPVPAGLNWDL